MAPINPIELSKSLIRCPSITPHDAGALKVLKVALEGQGFKCEELIFEETGTEPVNNIYARLGSNTPNLCFAGHTDVVPPGAEDLWMFSPFSGHITDNKLFGRGTSDMKCAIVAFLTAVSEIIATESDKIRGSISFLITGDEEGVSINGTKKVLKYLQEKKEKMDGCIVGEPTNPNFIGEMAKIGRRGSVNFSLTVTGTQGHAAYPNDADNPIPTLCNMLHHLTCLSLDTGSTYFDPSTITVTSIDTNNPATNIIPNHIQAKFNIRFNDLFSSKDIITEVKRRLDVNGAPYSLDVNVSGEAFLSKDEKLSKCLTQAVKSVTGIEPVMSTSGGTSDARFITNFCTTIEFGLINKTAHKINEHVCLEDIHILTKIYKSFVIEYFKSVSP